MIEVRPGHPDYDKAYWEQTVSRESPWTKLIVQPQTGILTSADLEKACEALLL